jgi:hypothetical protein
LGYLHKIDDFVNRVIRRRKAMASKPLLIMIRTNVPPEIEDKWNRWYDTQHIPARLDNAPGFISARRLVTINDDPKHLTLYDLAGMEALTSAPYLKIRETEDALPRDSFEAMTPNLPDFSRRLFEQIYPDTGEYGMPDTEIVFAVAHDVPPEKEDEFNAWYNTEHIPIMLERVPGFVTARRFVAVKPQLPPRVSDWLTRPKYLTLYDLESEDVLESDIFLRETHSPWSSWVRSWYTKQWRFLARCIYRRSSSG